MAVETLREPVVANPLRPGVRLMRRLRLPFKAGPIGLMLVVPMVALLASLCSRACRPAAARWPNTKAPWSCASRCRLSPTCSPHAG